MAAYNPTAVSTALTRVTTSATFAAALHGFVHGATVQISGAVPTGYNGSYAIDCQQVAITAISLSGTTVSVTTASPHGFVSGNTIVIAGVTPPLFNGNWTTIAGTTGSTITFTYATVVNLTVAESGTTVTVTTTLPHRYVNGQKVTMAGVTPAGYNGDVTITYVDPTTFTYTAAGALGLVTVIGTNQPGSGTAFGTVQANFQFKYTMSGDPGGSATVQGTAQVSNMDSFSVAGANDTLTIDRGAVLNVTTTQTRVWSTITGTQGQLNITNSSTSTGIRFLMGFNSGGASNSGNSINPNSSLFTLNVSGAFISLGSGNGTAQSFTTPFPQVEGVGYDFIPCVEVETSPGGGVYEWWFNDMISTSEMRSYLREGWNGVLPDTQKGKFFRQTPRAESTIDGALSVCGHYNNTLYFGDSVSSSAPYEGTSALAVTSGCNIRVPNILLTCGTPSCSTGGASTPCSVLSLTQQSVTAGNCVYSKCLFGEWSWTTPSYSLCTFDHCGISYGATFGTIYGLSITNCGIHSGRQRIYWETVGNDKGFRTVDLRNKVLSVVSAPGWATNNNQSMAQVQVVNSPNATISNTAILSHLRSTHTPVSVFLNQSPGTVVQGLKTYAGCVNVASCSNLLIDTWQQSQGYANEVQLFSPTGQNSTNQTTSARVGHLPALNSRTRYSNGTAYYFKVRTYYSYYDPSQYYDTPITYSATPYQGRMNDPANADAHPFWFGASLSTSTAGTAWSVWCTWNNVTLATVPTQPFNKIQIYRSTVLASLGAQQGGDIVGTTIISYNDTTIANNTTYYYTLRYYRDASNFFDSAQQIVIVPNFTPTLSTFPITTNLLLQSATLVTAPWANSGTTPTTVTNAAIANITQGNNLGGSSAGTLITFAAATNGGRTQSLTVTNAQTYTVTIWALCLATPSTPMTVDLVVSTGTPTTLNCSLTRKWQRFDMTYVAGSTTMTVTIQSNSSSWGRTAYFFAQVTNSSIALPYVATTTGASAATAGFAELGSQPASANTVVNSNIFAFSKEGRILVDLSPRGNASAYCEVFCGTSPSFTPSIANMVCSTGSTASNGNLLFNGNADTVTVQNVTSYGPNTVISNGATGTGAALISAPSGFQSNILLKNWNIDTGFSIPLIVYSFTSSYWNQFTLSNWTLTNSRGYGASLCNSQIACNNVNLVNVIADSGDYQDTVQASSNFIAKGSSFGDSGARYDAAVPNSFPFGLSVGGIAVPTGQFDVIFHELFTQDQTKGFMGLTFTPTTNVTVPPYSISGGCKFDNAGKLYFGAHGDAITYTWPWRIYGQTGWQNLVYKIRGADMGNNAATCFGTLVEYALSNDGVVFGSFKEMIYANTSTETITASLGFYLKVRITAKNNFKFKTLATNFVLNETIGNASSSPTATATVARIEVDPVVATTGTIWVTNVTGTWQYNDSIFSGATTRAAMNGNSVYGALYPFIQSSYLDALGWSTTVDATKLYPTLYAQILCTNLISGTYVAAYNTTTGAWLEATYNTTTATLQCPWDADFPCTVKLRQPGYRFQDNLFPLLTRIGGSVVGAQVAWTRISGTDPGAVSITFTDHGASPVTWNGKAWRYTIQVNDSSNAATVAQWWYWITRNDALTSGIRGTALPALVIEDSSTAYETAIGAITGVSTAAGGCRVIDSGGVALLGFSRLQANDGSYFAPPQPGTITLTVPVGSSVVIYDQTSARVSYVASSAGTESASFAAGLSGSYTYRVCKYGFLPIAGSVSVSTGGAKAVTVALSADSSITQPTVATVIAYTTLGTLDKLYDYLRYYETTTVGIDYLMVIKNGAALDLSSFAFTIDATASGVFAFTGSAITIKATNLLVGANFQGFLTTAAVATAHAARIDTWYTSVSGRSVLVLAPNIVSGSRFYAFNGGTDLDNSAVGAGGYYFRTLWTTDTAYTYYIAQLAGTAASAAISGQFLLTNTGSTLLDTQAANTVYNTNAIDGSLVSSVTWSTFTIEIDVTSTVGWKTIYASYCYEITTAYGIKHYFGDVLAQDTANYQFSNSITFIYAGAGTGAIVGSDGYGFRINGTFMGSNGIQIDNGKAYVAGGADFIAAVSTDIVNGVWSKVLP